MIAFLARFLVVLGCIPLTSFNQNVGLVTIIKVINHLTILILTSLFLLLGAFFNLLPQFVLGSYTVMMFGSIMYEEIKMNLMLI